MRPLHKPPNIKIYRESNPLKTNYFLPYPAYKLIGKVDLPFPIEIKVLSDSTALWDRAHVPSTQIK